MWKHKLLNIESFIYQRLVNTDDMLEDCNQSMIYCINKDNSPEDVIDQLFDFPNLYCSDTCYIFATGDGGQTSSFPLQPESCDDASGEGRGG